MEVSFVLQIIDVCSLGLGGVLLPILNGTAPPLAPGGVVVSAPPLGIILVLPRIVETVFIKKISCCGILSVNNQMNLVDSSNAAGNALNPPCGQ
ncbi:MAG: hypothetical protein ACKV0T_01145 [Planctomycetales bacterium]